MGEMTALTGEQKGEFLKSLGYGIEHIYSERVDRNQAVISICNEFDLKIDEVRKLISAEDCNDKHDALVQKRVELENERVQRCAEYWPFKID
jgi:DNA-binding transcriptional MerR regulator